MDTNTSANSLKRLPTRASPEHRRLQVVRQCSGVAEASFSRSPHRPVSTEHAAALDSSSPSCLSPCLCLFLSFLSCLCPRLSLWADPSPSDSDLPSGHLLALGSWLAGCPDPAAAFALVGRWSRSVHLADLLSSELVLARVPEARSSAELRFRRNSPEPDSEIASV